MALTNARDAYGGVAKTFHWVIALGIFAVIPLGIIAQNMPVTGDTLAQKALLFSIHKTIGLMIFFAALGRILWACTQPKPHLLNGEKQVESFLAQTIHWTLYGSLVLVPLTGWIHHAATEGYAPIWWPFGQSLPFVPKTEEVAQLFAGLHIAFERVLLISLILHIAGALKHHFVDKDDTLRRMLPGFTAARGTEAREGLLPFATATLAFVLAVGIGGYLGLYSKETSAAVATQLEEVQSQWQVAEGTLGITVSQFGSDVDGSFSEWTAAIDFDEEPTDGVFGTAEVTIAIGSLTLGSVTDQALGTDFFDAGGFPTATFSAQIVEGTDTPYVAEGTLTLKGAEVPLSLPFTLTIEGDTAQMTGTATLDRRDYGIGETYGDESTVGFTVGVEIELTAVRGGGAESGS